MKDRKQTRYTAHQLLAAINELPTIFMEEIGIDADETNAIMLGEFDTTLEQLRQKLENAPQELLIDELDDSVAFRCGVLIKILRSLGEIYSKEMTSKIFLTKEYDFLEERTLKNYLMNCSKTQLVEAWSGLESIRQTGYL